MTRLPYSLLSSKKQFRDLSIHSTQTNIKGRFYSRLLSKINVQLLPVGFFRLYDLHIQLLNRRERCRRLPGLIPRLCIKVLLEVRGGREPVSVTGVYFVAHQSENAF